MYDLTISNPRYDEDKLQSSVFTKKQLRFPLGFPDRPVRAMRLFFLEWLGSKKDYLGHECAGFFRKIPPMLKFLEDFHPHFLA